jgi:cytochrome c-type biogenesis protein CcmH/NrfG
LGEIGDKKTEMIKKYYFQGLREYDQGNVKKAIQLWEKVLEYDPAHMNAQTSLERAREEIKKE